MEFQHSSVKLTHISLNWLPFCFPVNQSNNFILVSLMFTRTILQPPDFQPTVILQMYLTIVLGEKPVHLGLHGGLQHLAVTPSNEFTEMTSTPVTR